jgi:mannan endo-1,4-beta-mannosidase
MVRVAVIALCLVASASATDFLKVDKASNTFTFAGKRVFLSGGNQPWIDYGNDFGNNQSNGKVCALRNYISNLTKSGGNTMRMWLFIEGDAIPAWDNSTGMVTGTDAAGSLIDELRSYAQYAAANNVFINLCLWNGAVLRNQKAIDLFSDTSKLDSFLKNALTPMVKALANEPGIGSWEIINEPEGSLKLTTDSNPCYDTQTQLANTGAGWAGHSFTMKQMLVFVSKQAAAIHTADPKALVTVGSWAQWVLSDALQPYQSKGFRNYYKDSCLTGASNASNGVLDYYQVHSYPNNAAGATEGGNPPFASSAADYKLDKPLVIGEFSHKTCKSKGCTVASLYAWAYDKGYQGAWDWAINNWNGGSVDGEVDMLPGLRSLKDKPFVAVKIGGYPPKDTCSCSDVAPDNQYTCEQQAGWGKCGQDFLKGFCCRSCHACTGCSSPPPTPPTPAPQCKDVPVPGTPAYTCAQQKSWGKCDVKVNPWMAGYCCKSCFNCAPGCGKTE